MRRTVIELTADRVRELLSYDRESGDFVWLLSRGRSAPAGSLAGCVSTVSGYRSIRVCGRIYGAHRLAWFYVNGRWPTAAIDHIDGRKTNNAIQNLREATAAQNGQNIRAAHADNRSGLLGVTPNGNRWSATIMVDGQKSRLGTFKTPEQAHAAYVEAKRIVHPHGTL